MSAGKGKRTRDRRKAAEKQWQAVHLRQRAIYSALLEIPDVCYRVPNLRRYA